MNDFSLNPLRRLRQRWQFLSFMGKSQAYKLSECTVFSIPNQEGHFRLGITIKARGSSVDRNKVKRVIRETFRTHAPVLGSRDYNILIPGYKKMTHPYSIQLRKALRSEFFKTI